MILLAMIISYLLLIINSNFFISKCDAEGEPWRRVNLISITNFGDLEDYYLQLRHQSKSENYIIFEFGDVRKSLVPNPLYL